MMYIVTLLTAVAAGFCQTVTGFGSGIILMQVLPNFYPLTIAPTISNAITAPICFSVFGRYRKHVHINQVLLIAVVYAIFSTVAIVLLGKINLNVLRITFGVFLVVLSIWFFFISDRIHIKPSMPVAFFCAALSGTLGGLFGIGGPPIAIYFLAATQTKEEYLGQVNGVFSCTVLYLLLLRIIKGYIPENFGVILIVGLVGVGFGCWFGAKLVDHINHSLLKKIIYILLAISGMIQILGI